MKSILLLIRRPYISPFLHLVAVFITAAMSHIQEDIQLDALKVLNIWLEVFPELAELYCVAILPNYIGLLTQRVISLNTTTSLAKSMVISTPSVRLSQTTSRANVIVSLVQFLEAAIQHEEHQERIEPDKICTTFEDIRKRSGFLLSNQNMIHSSAVSQKKSEHRIHIKLWMEALWRIIVDIWTEYRPGSSNHSITEATYKLLLDVLRLVSILWRWYLQMSKETTIEETERLKILCYVSEQLNKYFADFFPFGHQDIMIQNQKYTLFF
jgi:hypothetical protein